MAKTTHIRVSKSAWRYIYSQCRKQSKELGREVNAPEIVDELIKNKKRWIG